MITTTLSALLVLAGAPAVGLVLSADVDGALAPGAMVRLGALRMQDGVAVRFEPLLKRAWSVSSGEIVVEPDIDPYVVQATARAPLRGAMTVHLAIGKEVVERTFTVDPALLAPLVVSVDPPQIIKRGAGPQHGTVTVRGPAGPAPVVAVNTGQLSPLVATGPGEWRARYSPGPAPYPEVAVITAWRGWPHAASAAASFAHATLPLASAIVLPGETRPNVAITVEIAGAGFGPVTSDAKGHFTVPVVVPPGVPAATGTSIDRLGTRRVTAIDLRVPPLDRLVTVRAAHVEAASTGVFVGIVALDRNGAPSSAAPSVTAAKGRVSDVRALAPGRFAARYLPPALPGPDEIRLRSAEVPPQTVAVIVHAGAPARATLHVAPTLLAAPSNDPAVLTVSAVDARGAAVERFRLAGSARVGALSLSLPRDGPPIGRYNAPSMRRVWSDVVALEVGALAGVSPAQLAVSGGAVVVLDAHGRPVAGARVTAAGGAVTADAAGRVPLGPRAGGVATAGPTSVAVELRERTGKATLLLARGDDGALHGVPTVPAPLALAAEIALMDPLPVNVEATLDAAGRVTWDVSGGGGTRAVRIVAADGATVLSEARQGTSALPGPLPLLVQDVESGVGALVLAP